MKVTIRNLLRKALLPVSIGAIAAGLLVGVYGVVAQPGQSPNFAWLRGAALGSSPALVCQGLDTNVNCNVVTQGTGVLQVNGVPVTAGTAPTFTGLVTQLGGEVSLQTAPSGVTATLKASPIRLFHNLTDQPTTQAAIQTLYTYTLPANVLNTVGQSLHIQAEATIAANANNKRWNITFGATTISDSTLAAFNNVLIRIDCNVFLTGAATQKSMCQLISPTATGISTTINAVGTVTTPAENAAAPIVINFQGTTPTANGDLTARYAFVDLYPNGQ